MAAELALPAIARRPRGWYQTIAESPGNEGKRIHFRAGHEISLQRHHQRAEHWVVVRGTALVTVDEVVVKMTASQHIDIPLGGVHRIANRTTATMELAGVQFGSYLSGADIVRLQDDYGRN